MGIADWLPVLSGSSFDWYLRRLDAVAGELYARWVAPREQALCIVHELAASGVFLCWPLFQHDDSRSGARTTFKDTQAHLQPPLPSRCGPAGMAASRWWGTLLAAGSHACFWAASCTEVCLV